MSEITLSAGVRSNLLSLQNTAKLMNQTQTRLATGKKVNSALDNPTNFFTASSLHARSNDLSALLDSMSNGIKTLEAADNGLKAITKTVETMQATLRQARQDKSFQTSSFGINLGATPAGTEELTLSGGALGSAQTIQLTTQAVDDPATAGTFTLNASDFTASVFGTGDTITFDIDVDGGGTESLTITGAMVAAAGNNDATIDDVNELAEVINAAIAANGNVDASASVVGGNLVITSGSTGSSSSVAITNVAANDTSTDGTVTTAGLQNGSSTAGQDATFTTAAKSVDDLVSEINSNTDLNSAIRASNDNGKLRIQNLSTQDLNVAGLNAGGEISGGGQDADIAGNSVRAGLVRQFNELRDQLDKLADDASFNGINLLLGDNLRLTFNETGTSTIDIQVDGGNAINSAFLGINSLVEADFDTDATIDGLLGGMKNSLDTLRTQASAFGSNLSIVQNREEFTKSMMNTLQTGADNLILADTNEEGANMLALQTRQQLSSVALSLASQADQNVLRLF